MTEFLKNFDGYLINENNGQILKGLLGLMLEIFVWFSILAITFFLVGFVWFLCLECIADKKRNYEKIIDEDSKKYMVFTNKQLKKILKRLCPPLEVGMRLDELNICKFNSQMNGVVWNNKVFDKLSEENRITQKFPKPCECAGLHQ